MDELGLCEDQLYNADESGLYWKQLPEKTFVSSLEKTAPGAKIEKQRLTFMCCSNASGSHKLKLLVVGKAKKPRCFKNYVCPIIYKSSKSAWMTSALFKDWFHYSFVPEVSEFLKKEGLPVKALLLLDNAPSHPPESDLISQDGSICTMFLPPNVTSLIQPMDQNVFKITKLHYRNSLLSLIAEKKLNLLESVKTISLRDAINLLDSAWDRISPDILRKCWKNILDLVSDHDDAEENIPLNNLREIWQTELLQLEERAVGLLQELSPQVEVTISLIKEWNNNSSENQTECEIFEIHDESEGEEDSDSMVDQPEVTIRPREAVEALNKVLIWAEAERVDQREIRVLRNLKEKAMLRMIEQNTYQKKISDFFQ